MDIESIKLEVYDYTKEKEFYKLFIMWNGEIDYDVFVNSLDKMSKDERVKIVIACKENKMIGYAQTRRVVDLGFEEYYKVEQVFVREDFRKYGIGKIIMNKVEDIARCENVFEIRLNSEVDNKKAHSFYEKLGYEFYKTSKFYSKKI